MLWATIVLIVIFFGVPVLSTVVFTVLLVAAIYVDSAVFAYILRNDNPHYDNGKKHAQEWR